MYTYNVYQERVPMTWTYNNELVTEIPRNMMGFVYLITCKTTNRKYIGKKLFLFAKTSVRTVTLKSGIKKKKKIHSKFESDWKDYYGSSLELSADIEKLGKENFTREILHLCESKSHCSYIEAREQFERRVLESKEYYNGQIQCRIHKGHIIPKVLK